LKRHYETTHFCTEVFWCPVPGCDRNEYGEGDKKSFPRADKRDEHVRNMHKDLGY